MGYRIKADAFPGVSIANGTRGGGFRFAVAARSRAAAARRLRCASFEDKQCYSTNGRFRYRFLTAGPAGIRCQGDGSAGQWQHVQRRR